MHRNNFTLSNFRFENNTVITREGTLWNDMFMTPDDMTIRNNIFVLGGRPTEKVGDDDRFTHSNNLYYLVDGATMGGVKPGTGELLADPLFMDFKAKDFRLKPGSPAIKAGAKLGYTRDINGVPLPTAAAPSLGAYEYTAPDSAKR